MKKSNFLPIQKVLYSPICSGAFDCDNFVVKTPGGNSVRVCCMGYGCGPTVSLSTNSINFGDVRRGGYVQKQITITNTSNIPAWFQFDTEKDGVFRFDKTSGVIGPQKSLFVTIRFSPTKPINYYKRVFVLLRNQASLVI